MATASASSQRAQALDVARRGPAELAALLLRTTTALGDDDLIEIVRDGRLEQQLAIARRERLSPRLAAVITEFGAPAAVAAMLENRDAKIAPATLSLLVERSSDVMALRVPLLERRELQPAHAARLYLWVSPALRDHIARHYPIDREQLDRERAAAGRVAGAPISAGQPGRSDPAPAAALLSHLRQGEALQFEASFARLMRLRITSMRRIIGDRGGDHLAVACRAAGFTREEFQDAYRLLQSAGSRGPSAPAKPPLVPLGAIYDRIDEQHALDMIKRWRREPTANLTPVAHPSDPSPLPVPAVS